MTGQASVKSSYSESKFQLSCQNISQAWLLGKIRAPNRSAPIEGPVKLSAKKLATEFGLCSLLNHKIARFKCLNNLIAKFYINL